MNGSTRWKAFILIYIEQRVLAERGFLASFHRYVV